MGGLKLIVVLVVAMDQFEPSDEIRNEHLGEETRRRMKYPPL